MTTKFEKGKHMKEDIEQVLLGNASLDELIKMKIEQEFKTKKVTKTPEKQVITDINKMPPGKIFTKDSVFRVYNRTDKTETFINGIQADAMIGIQTGIREKFLNKTLSAFATDDSYVQFEKAVV